MKIRVVTRKVSGSTLPPLPSSKKKQRIPNKLVWTCVVLLAVGLGAGRFMDTEEKRETVTELSQERTVVRNVPEIPEITKTFHSPEPVAQASEQETAHPSPEVGMLKEESTPNVGETQKTAVVSKADPTGEDEKKTTSPEPKEEEEPVESWQAERLYQPGDRVKYEDKVYVAERENQGVQPGTDANGEEENPWKRVDT